MGLVIVWPSRQITCKKVNGACFTTFLRKRVDRSLILVFLSQLLPRRRRREENPETLKIQRKGRSFFRSYRFLTEIRRTSLLSFALVSFSLCSMDESFANLQTSHLLGSVPVSLKYIHYFYDFTVNKLFH